MESFSELPHPRFGHNQLMETNKQFKEALREVIWKFKAPIKYAFAYGSGVFSQSSKPGSSAEKSPHPNPPDAVLKWQTGGPKSIDYIFGVSHTQHFHSLNLRDHRDHYSFLGSLGSYAVSKVQDNMGAGVYYNPYVVINGIMLKYGVVNVDTLYTDLSEWKNLYLAGRLQKPVKILRDDPRLRLANQINLISALRTALLTLPPSFTEKELYTKIAGLSYLGDPRMAVGAENPKKITNIVENQMVNFRQLYLPLIEDLPNVAFKDRSTSKPTWTEDSTLDCRLEQDMNPVRRGNMVRRLPSRFRRKIYDEFQYRFKLDVHEYRNIIEDSKSDNTFSSRSGNDFDRRIAGADGLTTVVEQKLVAISRWPTATQSLKGILSAGPVNSWRYWSEKRLKGKMQKLVKDN
jgi:translocator assembly and maintenance protein 41